MSENFVDKPLYVGCNWLTGLDSDEGVVIEVWEFQQSLNPGDSVCEVACQYRHDCGLKQFNRIGF